MVGNEPIGISDGTVAFDTQRTDGQAKTAAAANLAKGDVGGALSQLSTAVGQDTNDAEALIYQENLRIINSPQITTFVVATMLTGDSGSVGVGRDDLQGAYVAQKAYNDGALLSGGAKIRLLVANAGSKDAYATTVANQIVQLAQSDKTFAGVMGMPFSAYAINAIQVLSRAQIPMVSQTASSDQLTGFSPYFFRVAPPNKSQGIAGSQYAEKKLNAHKVAIFVDNNNAYSQSLAQAFSQQFTGDGNSIVATEHYTVGQSSTIPGLLTDALSKNPDLVYFSGYASDLGVLLTNLATSNAPASLSVLGGDALYELGGYTQSARPALNRLHFTTFFYPDEWEVLGLTSKKPIFFTQYANDFAPNGVPAGQSSYNYTRPTNDAALSYDATLALLKAYNLAYKAGKTSPGPQDIQQALKQINGANAIQGVSGQISFGPDGDPIQKAVVILYFDQQAHIQIDRNIIGKFLI
jgi:ABC-type branched-subunit amino acid transport system substrate-binding protein